MPTLALRPAGIECALKHRFIIRTVRVIYLWLKRTCVRSAMDDRQEALLDNFISVTNCERERAVFYLQASRWDLEVRV